MKNFDKSLDKKSSSFQFLPTKFLNAKLCVFDESQISEVLDFAFDKILNGNEKTAWIMVPFKNVTTNHFGKNCSQDNKVIV